MVQTQGGLVIPDHIGISDHELAEIQQQHDTFDDVELTLSKLGFNPIEKPQRQCPKLTAEILATVNTVEYSSAYTQFNSWHSYAHNTLARLKAYRLQISREMDDIARRIRMASYKTKGAGKGPSKEQLSDLVESNPRYMELDLTKLKLDQQIMLTESQVDSLERDLRLISRQIELLRMDHENGRTEHNIPNRGRAPGRLT